MLSSVSPYLYPFVLEYSLIAMGTLVAMSASITKRNDGERSVVRGLSNLFRVHVLDSGPRDDGVEQHHDGGVVLMKSHRGLFLGVLLLAVSIVSIITFFFVEEYNSDDQALVIFLSTDMILHGVMLFAAVLALVRLNGLSYVNKPTSVDDVLLLISMSGSILYELSVIMASGDYIRRQRFDVNWTHEVLRLSGSMLAATQTLVQVRFAFR